jgi:hypothetical protein
MSFLFNSPSKDSPSQKKVTFSTNAEMRIIKETAQSSGDTTWYQPRHYNAFMVDCQKTAETVARDVKGLSNLTYARKYFFSTRGLEHYVDQERGALRRDRRLAAWDLVLDEQMYQYESGYYQPQHIAEAYQEVSVRSQIEAHVTALEHLKESEGDHQSESTLLCKAQKSYEQCNKNLRSMLTRPLGMKNVYKCDTNLRSMMTRPLGMKNVYKRDTNLRSMMTRRQGMKNVYECTTNLRSMMTRRQGMKNVYECNTNLHPTMTRRQGVKNVYECSTNLRPMMTRRQGMKNVYECNTNLRSMLTRRQGMKNVFIFPSAA